MLDKMVENYLKKHHDAIVINIACGLDTRCYCNELLADKLSSFNHVADHSLAEGMAVFASVYRVLKHIPLIAGISNKIVVLRK